MDDVKPNYVWPETAKKITAEKLALAPGAEMHARAVHEARGTLVVPRFADAHAFECEIVREASVLRNWKEHNEHGCGAYIRFGWCDGTMRCGATLKGLDGDLSVQMCEECGGKGWRV